MTTKRVLVLPILLLATVLSGCSDKDAAIDEFSQSLTAYMTSPDEQGLQALIESYMDVGYIGTKGLLEREEDAKERRHRWWKIQGKTQRVLIHSAQWGALSTMYRNGMRASDEAKELLALKYQGNDAELLEVLGWGAYRSGEIYQAYKAFEGAALSDNSRATLPRGFAFHYGCADLYQIWGELKDYRSGFDGDPIPLSEPTLSRRELVEARAQLRKGVAPEIPANCPIKPMKADKGSSS